MIGNFLGKKYLYSINLINYTNYSENRSREFRENRKTIRIKFTSPKMLFPLNIF